MTIAIGLAEYRESVQQFEVQSVKPPGAAVRADSPVHGLDALLPALPQQGCESAAVRIQRWYRHKQAERQVRFSPAVHMTTAKPCVVHTAVAEMILYTVLQHKSGWHLPMMAVIMLRGKGLHCRCLYGQPRSTLAGSAARCQGLCAAEEACYGSTHCRRQ